MFSTMLPLILLGIITPIVAQSTPTILCVAGQCLQGYSNTTIGAKLSATGASSPLHLLPGQYSSTTNPQLLHNLLVSPSASLSTSPGFSSNASASISLPLNLALGPGLSIYSDALYSGQAAFSSLPTTPIINSSTQFSARSIALSENVWVAVSSSSNEDRVILWESVPDVSQISLSSSLALHDIQSTSCSPACSSSGICTSSGQCLCPPNFTGASCESCAPGFFGPQCQSCPEGCDKCDEGISGTGRCLSPQIGSNDPRKCNCVNGVCNSDGSCTCNDAWVDKGDGTKCSKCAPGFFLSSTGDCSACQLGCSECSDTTGVCNACKSGFTQNINDRTKCDAIQPVLSTGALCPSGSFSDGTRCQVCSNLCASCSGAGDGDCLTCAQGLFMSNGQCVTADTNGVCSGNGGLIADNVKRVCDSCPAKCTSCRIPSFNGASTLNELQCTGCLPGSVLSNGKCVDSCPAGTFVNPQDNLTCIPCSSSCGTCAGSADFCLSCPGSLLASGGKCVATCPAGTFSSETSTSSDSTQKNACLSCHPDCLTCTGSSFTQCTSCPASRPVLSTATGSSSGRCLPTCSKSQYFDATTRQCQACDGSCGSCSGPGPSRCLSCQSSLQVVRGGQCVDASCTSNTGIIPGLGVCLSDLVQVPTTTNGANPLPSVSGLGDPTVASGKGRLAWWQILLMALGCAFIFVVILWCWRRKARKQRQKKTQAFATGKGIRKGSGRWGWFAGWRLLFSKKSKGAAANRNGGEGELPIAYNHHEVTSRGLGAVSIKGGHYDEGIKMSALQHKGVEGRTIGSRRNNRDSDDLDSYYNYSRRSMSVQSRTPSTLPDLDGYYHPSRRYHDRDQLRKQVTDGTTRTQRNIERESMYSEMTGAARNTPEPRIPVKRDLMTIPSGHGGSSSSSSRAPSPGPPPNKLKKKVVEKKPSKDTLSSVVIGPQKEGTLIELEDGSVPSSALPLQYQSPLATFQLPLGQGLGGLSDAQAYAMSVRPGLLKDLTGGSTSVSSPWSVPTSNFASSNLTAVSSPLTNAGLGSGATGSGANGFYWPSRADPLTSSNGGLKRDLTGSSTLTSQTVASNNPFRNAALASP